MEQLTPDKLMWIIGMAVVVLVLRTLYANRSTLQTWLAGDRPLFHVLVGYHDVLSSNEDDGIETPDSTASEPVSADPIPSSERDIIIALARLRGANGQYRYSANEITKFIKLSRNEVLDIIRPERSGKAEMPDTYQAEPARTVYSRDDPTVAYLDNRPVKRAANGEEYLMIGNQYIPRDLYEVNADMFAAQAA